MFGHSNKTMEDCEDLSYLGRWRLSSYKDEYGLANLLDPDTNKYWQSDGEFPHYVEIQFSKLVKIKRIEIFCSSANDSSYAPKDISVDAGFGPHELFTVNTLHFNSNSKTVKEWCTLDLDKLGPNHDEMLECTLLRVKIDMNFFHGKDSHLRGLRICGPISQQRNESLRSKSLRI